MAQYRKEEVADRIAAAALAVFAERGYAAATMAMIAERAGLSIGNLYRYHASKQALLEAVVPAAFVDRLRALLTRRVASLSGVTDIGQLPPGSAFEAASEELFAFAVAHRLRVVVALGRGDGSPYEGLTAELVDLLRGLALDHFRALTPGLVVDEALRYDLELVYRNLVQSVVAVLARFDDGAKIRSAVDGLSAYHLAGLARLFATFARPGEAANTRTP